MPEPKELKRARDKKSREKRKMEDTGYSAHRAALQREYRKRRTETESDRSMRKRRKDRKIYMQQHRLKKKQEKLGARDHIGNYEIITIESEESANVPIFIDIPTSANNASSSSAVLSNQRSESAKKRERRRVKNKCVLLESSVARLQRKVWRLEKRCKENKQVRTMNAE